jgi:hypothetical protein
VAIFSWVFASTSGLTRTVIGATRPSSTATRESRASSGSLSTLNCRMPPSSASRISSAVFPTPENTIRSPGTPAAFARRYSPPDTTSIPAPSDAISAITAWFEFDFMAKQIRCGPQASASSNSRKCRVRVAAE